MIENLPIAVAQVKADNTSESLLNEIHQKLCSLFKQKKLLHEFSKKFSN